MTEQECTHTFIRRRSFVCGHCHQSVSRTVRASRDAGRYCSRQCAFDRLAIVAGERKALRRIGNACRAKLRSEARRAAAKRLSAAAIDEKLGRDCSSCGARFTQDTHLGRPEARCRPCADALKRERRKAERKVAKAKRRAVERGAMSENIDPIRVFERDKWRCHLCGMKTDRALRGTWQDKAPELDHIVSLADGGSHTWGNVACACRKCNQAKGAVSAGQLGLGFAA